MGGTVDTGKVDRGSEGGSGNTGNSHKTKVETGEGEVTPVALPWSERQPRPDEPEGEGGELDNA